MSEYETTDLGGDPVEFEFVEGGTYERGVIRSTADHQQIRRDAEHWLSEITTAVEGGPLEPRADRLARHCLALLDELEQAERVRDQEHELNQGLFGAMAKAEARLANWPALVEAAKAASTAVKMAATIEGIDFAVPYLDEALTAWDDQ